MIRCELALLQKAYHSNVEFDYFHLLSGHDYPCRSAIEFDSFFDINRGRSFMHYDTDKQHAEWKEKISRRVNKWHLADTFVERHLRLRRYAQAFLNRTFPRKFTGELYAGWNWFSWHRSLVAWILNYCDNHPEYLKRFHHTDCCDEVVFHTLLYSHIDELNIDRDNSLRYIDWFPDRPAATLPLVLDERDFSKIINSDCLFCRKVRIPDSNLLLEQLDNRVSK